jgi:manganese transport protein
VKLGVATKRDLAQACRDAFSPAVSRALWIAAEVAICACDLGAWIMDVMMRVRMRWV